jgi:hypothetical protein
MDYGFVDIEHNATGATTSLCVSRNKPQETLLLFVFFFVGHYNLIESQMN